MKTLEDFEVEATTEAVMGLDDWVTHYCIRESVAKAMLIAYKSGRSDMRRQAAATVRGAIISDSSLSKLVSAIMELD